jgi:hypothetical protein
MAEKTVLQMRQIRAGRQFAMPKQRPCEPLGHLSAKEGLQLSRDSAP